MDIFKIQTKENIKDFLNKYRGYNLTFYNEHKKLLLFRQNNEKIYEDIIENTFNDHDERYFKFNYALLIVGNIRIGEKKGNQAEIIIINKLSPIK